MRNTVVLLVPEEYSVARARFGLRQFAEQASPGFSRGLPEEMGTVLQERHWGGGPFSLGAHKQNGLHSQQN